MFLESHRSANSSSLDCGVSFWSKNCNCVSATEQIRAPGSVKAVPETLLPLNPESVSPHTENRNPWCPAVNCTGQAPTSVEKSGTQVGRADDSGVRDKPAMPSQLSERN